MIITAGAKALLLLSKIRTPLEIEIMTRKKDIFIGEVDKASGMVAITSDIIP